jgi:hypothetical protein
MCEPVVAFTPNALCQLSWALSLASAASSSLRRRPWSTSAVRSGRTVRRFACKLRRAPHSKPTRQPLDAPTLAGYTLALDLTARDMQNEAKKKGTPCDFHCSGPLIARRQLRNRASGLPWTAAKGLDCFCPIGRYVSECAAHRASTNRFLGPKTFSRMCAGGQRSLQVTGCPCKPCT